MADYDRVRYAQGGEPPLSFDRRAPSRGGGPAPVTLILSLLLLAGVGGGVFYMYRSGLRGPGDAPRPVGAPIGEVRTTAPPQAQAPDPGAGLTIYKDDPNAATATPAFVPPPEQPAPRPTAAAPPPPATASVVAAKLAPAPTSPGAPPVAKPAGLLAAPASPSSKATSAALTAALPPHAKAKAAKTASIDAILADAGPGPVTAPIAKAHATVNAKAAAAKASADGSAPADPEASADAKAASKAPTAGGKPPVVQIGAYSSKDLAEAGWNAAAGAAPGDMAGKAKHVVPLAKADGSTLYRTSITGFASRDQALALCARLKAAGQSCFVR